MWNGTCQYTANSAYDNPFVYFHCDLLVSPRDRRVFRFTPPHNWLSLSLTTTSCKINNKKSYSTKAFGSYDEWFGSTSWFWYWGWPHKKRRQGGMEWSGGLGWDTVILSYSQPTLTTRLLPFCLLIYTINHTTLPPVQPHPMPWTPYIFSKAGI